MKMTSKAAKALGRSFGGVCRYQEGSFVRAFSEDNRISSLYETKRFPMLHDRLVELKTELTDNDQKYPDVLNG